MKKSAYENGSSAKRVKKHHPVLIVIIIFLLLAALLIASAAIFAGRLLGKINRIDYGAIKIVPPSEATDEVDVQNIENKDIDWWKTEKLDSPDLVNIILVGQDTRGEERERSDAMILCSVNIKTFDISLISFMRDLYVQMPEGYMDNRMNAAYAFGGFPYLYEVFEKNFGIIVDGGIEVDFSGFKNIINILGGVDIELTAAEAEYLGKGLHEGKNHLTAAQALSYSRIRHLDSDFGRTQRQRNVLNSIYASVKGSDVKTILSLADSFLPYVTTDMTNTQILDLTFDLGSHISSLNVKSYRIPVDDGYCDDIIRGMMVLVPDLKANHDALKNYLPLT